MGSRRAGRAFSGGQPTLCYAMGRTGRAPDPLVAVSSRLPVVGTTPSHMSIWEKFSAPPACWVQAE